MFHHGRLGEAPAKRRTSPLSSWYLTGGPPAFSPPQIATSKCTASRTTIPIADTTTAPESPSGDFALSLHVTEDAPGAGIGTPEVDEQDSGQMDLVAHFLEMLASETRAWDEANAMLELELSKSGLAGVGVG